MKIPLNTPARRWLVVVFATVLALAYIGLSASRFAASLLATRSDFASLRRANLFDPGNADYRDRLGRFYDLEVHDPASAVTQYGAAVALNPHSAAFWFDLARAFQVLGDSTKQTAALEGAIHADSMTPDVAWEAANLYLVQGENQKALREFRVVLANDASLAPSAIQFCWRIEPDVDALLLDIVPPRNEAYIPFLGLLETKQETAGAAKVWDALLQTNQPFERRYADEYFTYLVYHKEVDQAVRVWQQTTDRFRLSSYLPSPGNLIVNGSFDLDVLNAGLDWQYQKQSRVVQLILDPNDTHGSRQALTVTFDGPGINDAGIFQFVAVQPNTTYLFSAYYKTIEQQGAGGPHITIQDMYTQAIYYESEELRDAGFWKPAQGEFTTGPDCKLVVLHIRRLPAGLPIRGKIWVNDFRLTAKP